LIRSQINDLYSNPSLQISDSSSGDNNPYHQSHTNAVNITKDQWDQYHTAWQNYYRQYYEGYYTQKSRKLGDETKEEAASNQTGQQYFGNPPKVNKKIIAEATIFDLRQKFLAKIQESTAKFRRSHHFTPVMAGLAVVLVFLFLQYNRVLISNVMAYVSPGNIDPQNIVIDPSTDITVSPEPRLIIPKINVDVPVVYDVGSDYDSQMAAMTSGVAHFAVPGASSHPGQTGNTVIAGHSSNDLLDTGDYKFIFAQLDKLAIGDTLHANYNSRRYTYTVTKKEVVNPNEVSKLVYPTTKPILTLLTCTPLGTSKYRLLVTAEQISPDPSQATAAPTQDNDKSSTSSIPGNSPTLIERIFGNQ
jgi:sortase A